MQIFFYFYVHYFLKRDLNPKLNLEQILAKLKEKILSLVGKNSYTYYLDNQPKKPLPENFLKSRFCSEYFISSILPVIFNSLVFVLNFSM